MKKLVSMIVAFCFLMCQTSIVFADEKEMEFYGKSIILIDAYNGDVFYEKNSEEQRIPASVTKLMTLFLALEQLNFGAIHKDDIVTTSQYAASMGGSQIYLSQGEQLRLEEMLIAIAVGSANDASVAVAEHIAGSCENFVVMMNEKAAELGMNHTHFANPNGLPMDEHYTTAKDLAILAKAILDSYPEILDYTSIQTYTLRKDTNPFVMNNTNKLLWWYEDVDGLKTGWIGEESGYNVVATVKKGDLRLIAVVLGAPKVYENFKDCMQLFDWGYEKYCAIKYYEKRQVITTVSVEKGSVDFIDVTTEQDIVLTLEQTQKEQVKKELFIQPLCAPIEKGAVVGNCTFSIEGETIATYPLFAKESVERYGYLTCLKKIFLSFLQ